MYFWNHTILWETGKELEPMFVLQNSDGKYRQVHLSITDFSYRDKFLIVFMKNHGKYWKFYLSI